MRLAFALCALAIFSSCDGDPADPDGGRDAARAVDSGPPGDLLPACEETEADGTDMLELVSSTLVAAIVPNMPRASEPGPTNPSTEAGELMYRAMQYDRVSHGPARERMMRRELGGEEPPAEGRRSIVYFAQTADPQLADDESTTRLALVDNPSVPGGLRSQEAFLPQMMSAMNRTLARIERAERPYDFGIVNGDCADSAQENELRWVLEIMNGASGVHVDSGDDDDPIAGPGNDPKDPFDATAFPAPWLFVPGNHDVEVVGITTPDPGLEETALGTRPRAGTRDYRRWYAPVTTQSVPADPERHILSREEIVTTLLADVALPGPPGHGYADADVTNGANYEYDAVEDLLRIVTLDTNDDTGGSNGLVHRRTVDEFLEPALARAEADGVLVILSSHHATSSIDTFRGQLGDTVVEDAVPPEELESIVASHPNVILWLVGHSHDNRVRAVRGPDAAHPGYWEVMGSALADYPGQARIIEIVENTNDTLSIFATTIDFDAESCAERRYRRLLVMEWVSGWTDDVSDDPLDHNVELVIPTPPGAEVAIDAATAFDRIESETTLRGP
jgi:hypothetical protein